MYGILRIYNSVYVHISSFQSKLTCHPACMKFKGLSILLYFLYSFFFSLISFYSHPTCLFVSFFIIFSSVFFLSLPSICSLLSVVSFFLPPSLSLPLPDLSSVKSSFPRFPTMLPVYNGCELEKERGRMLFTEENPPERERKD